MPDGTRPPEQRIEACARLMTRVTRHWAELDASGPRSGPVRDAISKLEPVFFAQMIVAMDHWVRTIEDGPTPEGANARLRTLSEQILSAHHDEEAGDPDPGLPHLTSIDFVQLWPKVIRELREEAAPDLSTGSSGPSTPSP